MVRRSPGTRLCYLNATVLGYCTLGAYAEYVVVSPEQVAAKPESMPWDIAGGFSANGVGAHLCPRELKIGPGDTVLIHAVAGALGAAAHRSIETGHGRGKIVLLVDSPS